MSMFAYNFVSLFEFSLYFLKENCEKKTARLACLPCCAAGCMAERLKTKLLESDKLVDLVAGPDAYRDLPNLLSLVRGGDKAVNVQLSQDETYADIAPVRPAENTVSGWFTMVCELVQRGYYAWLSVVLSCCLNFVATLKIPVCM